MKLRTSAQSLRQCYKSLQDGIKMLCTFLHEHFYTELTWKYYIHHLLSHCPTDGHHQVEQSHLENASALG